ncbi:MAG: hypothetical protein ACFHU9_02230 [Fluviicola sp.]
MKSKIYIDIDGVLLDKGQATPEGAERFIHFIVHHFDCYWLTTHCRLGVNKAVEYLSPFYDQETIVLLDRVKPTEWDALKTEAIDFDSTFFWLEDYPFEAEISELRKNDKNNSLIKVNLNAPNELDRIQKLLSD